MTKPPRPGRRDPGPFPPGSQVAAYLRDSGGEDQDLSIEQQESSLVEWVKDNDYALTQVFKDTASGSSTVGRTQFQAMLHHFRNDAQEAGIVVWKFNRFARSLDDAQFYRADLRRRGYEVHSLNDNLPPGIDGRFFEAAIDWMNEKFLQDLSIDIKRGLRHLTLEYGGLPGRPPVGFQREPIHIGKRRNGTEHIVHRWVVDADTIPLVITAFQMRAEGRTYREIDQATHLYPNKNGYQRMFRNRLYIGEVHRGDTVILDYCEPVIDQTTWDKVQEIHRIRREINGQFHPRRINSNFILSGLVYCGVCKTIMNGHVIADKYGKRYTYYRCTGWDCKARVIPQSILENAILDNLKHEIITPENLAAVMAEARQSWHENQGKRDKEQARLNRQLSTVTRKINNLVNVMGDTGNRTLLEKLQELERRETDLLAQLDRLGDIPDTVLDLDIESVSAHILQELNPSNEKINGVLRELLYRIEAKRKNQIVRVSIDYLSPFDTYGDEDIRRSTQKHKLKVYL
jgi:site-specific DNA recombinase